MSDGNNEGLWPLVNEAGQAERVSADQMDHLWAAGWRHFGRRFYRYSLMWQDEIWKKVIPLRIPVRAWKASKSQRRTLRRNEDLAVTVAPLSFAEEEQELFQKHKARFTENVPERLEDFLGSVGESPCETVQVSVKEGGRLVAASFLDLGKVGCSSVYGIHDPELDYRRLGIFTMLQELGYAQSRGMHYYYSGYATIDASNYDYKKEWKPLEVWNWQTWEPFSSAVHSTPKSPSEVDRQE